MDLIQRVKNKCYITDNDPIITERVNDMIEDAKVKIKELIGVESDSLINFDAVGRERELFLNYCLYAWNDSSNEFTQNYIDDIMSLRSKYEVEQYAIEETN